MISTPLMREKPVRSPMVPPIADSWSTNLAARSFLIISKVEVDIEICTNLSLFTKARSRRVEI